MAKAKNRQSLIACGYCFRLVERNWKLTYDVRRENVYGKHEWVAILQFLMRRKEGYPRRSVEIDEKKNHESLEILQIWLLDELRYRVQAAQTVEGLKPVS